MRDFIGCILLAVIFALGLYYEHKDKKRKEYEEWIYFRRAQLQRNALRFRDDCQSLTEKVFAQYTNELLWKRYRHVPDYILYSFLSTYREDILRVKSEYIANSEIQTLPNFLIEEYEKNLSDIADSFSELANLMRNQIEEVKEER